MSRNRQQRVSKRTLEQWLSEYAVSHQNLVNKKSIGCVFPPSLSVCWVWVCRFLFGSP